MKQLLTLALLVCAPVCIFSHTGYYMTDHENSHNFGTNFGGYSNTLQLGSGGGLAGSLDNFFNPQQLALGFGLGLAKAMVLAALGAGFSRARSRSHRNDNPDKSYGNQNSAYISKSIISHPENDDRYRGDLGSYQGKNPYIYSKYMDHTIGDIGDYGKKSGHSYGALPHQGPSSVSYQAPSYNGQSYGDSYARLTKGDYNVDQTSGINGKYGDTSTSAFSYGRSNGVNDYKDMYQIQPSYSDNTIARSGSVRYKSNDYPDNYNDYSAGNAKYGVQRNAGLNLFSLHRRFAKAKTTLLRGLLSPLANLNIFGAGGSSGQESYQRSNNNYASHSTNNPKPSFSLSPSLGLGAYLGAKAGLIKGVIMSRVLSDSGILKSDDGY